MLNGGLNKTQIQFIAIICMTLDHIAWAFSPGYSHVWWAVAFHIVGRVTAPVMWFFVAKGYEKTKNVGKYALRLLIFAVISHFAFNFFEGSAFNPFAHTSPMEITSVIWGLLCGLSAVYIYDSKKIKAPFKALIIFLLCVLAFGADWTFLSVLAILWIHINEGKFARQAAGVTLLALSFAVYMFIAADKLYSVIQMGVCLSLVPMYFYNEKKGHMVLGKYFFYIYYPAHMALLGLLKILI